MSAQQQQQQQQQNFIKFSTYNSKTNKIEDMKEKEYQNYLEKLNMTNYFNKDGHFNKEESESESEDECPIDGCYEEGKCDEKKCFYADKYYAEHKEEYESESEDEEGEECEEEKKACYYCDAEATGLYKDNANNLQYACKDCKEEFIIDFEEEKEEEEKREEEKEEDEWWKPAYNSFEEAILGEFGDESEQAKKYNIGMFALKENITAIIESDEEEEEYFAYCEERKKKYIKELKKEECEQKDFIKDFPEHWELAKKNEKSQFYEKLKSDFIKEKREKKEVKKKFIIKKSQRVKVIELILKHLKIKLSLKTLYENYTNGKTHKKIRDYNKERGFGGHYNNPYTLYFDNEELPEFMTTLI